MFYLVSLLFIISKILKSNSFNREINNCGWDKTKINILMVTKQIF